jgi:translation initiation factor IF-1
MAKEELLKFDGIVCEVLSNGMYRVEVNGIIVMAYISGNIRKNKIRILQKDQVEVEMSPYDLTKGRITYRYK